MASAPMKINITLDSASIDKAIQRIESYQKSIQSKANKLLMRLADIGVAEVQNCFAATNYHGDGGEPKIYREKTENGYKVVADGDDVLFIEFGTGDAAFYPEDVGINVYPGSWSSTEGTGEYAKYGSWHHKKVKYRYSDPALGFVRAKAEILYQAPTIAKEIFNVDFG